MPFISRFFISEKCFKILKENSMQIPSKRSQIRSFRPDGPIMRPNTHQCLEDSNNSRLHPSRRRSNTSERSSVFDKKLNFLHRHKYGKTVASVRMTRQQYSEAILDKVRHGEELKSFGRKGNTIRTQSLLWYLRAAEVQPSKR
jgi:hypothetical protein